MSDENQKKEAIIIAFSLYQDRQQEVVDKLKKVCEDENLNPVQTHCVQEFVYSSFSEILENIYKDKGKDVIIITNMQNFQKDSMTFRADCPEKKGIYSILTKEDVTFIIRNYVYEDNWTFYIQSQGFAYGRHKIQTEDQYIKIDKDFVFKDEHYKREIYDCSLEVLRDACTSIVNCFTCRAFLRFNKSLMFVNTVLDMYEWNPEGVFARCIINDAVCAIKQMETLSQLKNNKYEEFKLLHNDDKTKNDYYIAGMNSLKFVKKMRDKLTAHRDIITTDPEYKHRIKDNEDKMFYFKHIIKEKEDNGEKVLSFDAEFDPKIYNLHNILMAVFRELNHVYVKMNLEKERINQEVKQIFFSYDYALKLLSQPIEGVPTDLNYIKEACNVLKKCRDIFPN